jgi:hypothetical protein
MGPRLRGDDVGAYGIRLLYAPRPASHRARARRGYAPRATLGLRTSAEADGGPQRRMERAVGSRIFAVANSGMTGGKRGAVEQLPAMEVAPVPASLRYVSKKWQDCNGVQGMEGSIDTAHFSFAHLTSDKLSSSGASPPKAWQDPRSAVNWD